MKLKCDYCNKIKQKDGSFQYEDEDFTNKEDISHGICPECKEIELLKYRNRKKKL
jgi:phage FluMu protein Com